MKSGRPIVLSIAGFDPCGGAGVLADVKTFEQHGVQGMAVVTANTIQTAERFLHLEWMDIDIVAKGIEALMQRYPVQAVKIGIVKDASFLTVIIESIRQYHSNAFITWDPVLKSSSGFQFFNTENGTSLSSVLNKTDLITPNFDEYQALRPLFETAFSKALLIKGGHRKDNPGSDILRQGKKEIHLLPGSGKVYAKHGSGCVLSAAITANIAMGKDMAAACRQAKLYTEDYLSSHSSLLGHHAKQATIHITG